MAVADNGILHGNFAGPFFSFVIDGGVQNSVHSKTSVFENISPTSDRKILFHNY